MKKIEYADLAALGADTMTLEYYSGADFIKSIWEDGTTFILNSIDGKTVYDSADELLMDLKSMAIEELKIIEGNEALKMTYAEYFEKHDTENFSWCKPYADKTGDYMLVMHDGELSALSSPDIIAYRYDGSLTDETMKQFAIAINPNYDLYSGWTDLHIALDVMHETGCAHCPFKYECDAMQAEIDDTDYR